MLIVSEAWSRGHSLSAHKLGRKHAALGGSLAVLDLGIHLAPLLHDEVEHVVGVVHPAVRLGHELVDGLAKQRDVAARVAENVVEERGVVGKLGVSATAPSSCCSRFSDPPGPPPPRTSAYSRPSSAP